jgi:hypothetical protein
MKKLKGLKSIYVATHEYTQLYKVGISEDTTQRLSQLSAGVGATLRIVYESEPIANAREFEQIILDNFKEYRKLGEWLHIEESVLLSFICELEKQFDPDVYNCLWENHVKNFVTVEELDTDIFNSKIKTMKYSFVDEYTIKDGVCNYYIQYRQGNLVKTLKIYHEQTLIDLKNRLKHHILRIYV